VKIRQPVHKIIKKKIIIILIVEPRIKEKLINLTNASHKKKMQNKAFLWD